VAQLVITFVEQTPATFKNPLEHVAQSVVLGMVCEYKHEGMIVTQYPPSDVGIIPVTHLKQTSLLLDKAILY
jgi:hypothetical protein